MASKGDEGGNGLSLLESDGGLAATFADGLAGGVVDLLFGFDFHDGGRVEVGRIDAAAIGDAVGMYDTTILIDFDSRSGDGDTADGSSGNWVDNRLLNHFNIQLAVGIFVTARKK